MRPQLLLPDRRVWHLEVGAKGEVSAGLGDRVEPDAVVGRYQAAAPAVIVQLGQAQPTVSEGQEVQAGEVVARRKKFIGTGEEVQAPIAGKVLMVAPGQLLLQPPALTLAVEAELPGTIAAARPAWGLDVEGCFGLLHGCGCIGSSLHGRLGDDVHVVPEPLTTAMLQSAASQGARGVVAPNWGEDGTADAAPDGPALFFTEPFKGRAMAAPIAEILQRHKGRPVALRLDRQPLLAFASEDSSTPQSFGTDAWVRTADGLTGRILETSNARFFGSGLRGVAANVDLGDRTETMPLDSLDWIA